MKCRQTSFSGIAGQSSTGSRPDWSVLTILRQLHPLRNRSVSLLILALGWRSVFRFSGRRNLQNFPQDFADWHLIWLLLQFKPSYNEHPLCLFDVILVFRTIVIVASGSRWAKVLSILNVSELVVFWTFRHSEQWSLSNGLGMYGCTHLVWQEKS